MVENTSYFWLTKIVSLNPAHGEVY